MVCLNENQVSQIRQLILARGAEMEELTNDLLDHICCMIEERMGKEEDYEEVLEETMAVFGNNGIRNIQDETTFLLTKNILAMKKTTHIIGIIAAVLLLVGSIFKIKHLPGAGVMYVSGGFLLSFIFLPLLLTLKIKEKLSKPKLWLNIAGTVSGFILINAVFFKVMHWPYANILMWTGGMLGLFVFVPLYVYSNIKYKELRSTTINNTVIVVGAMSLFFALVKVHNSGIVTDSILNIQYTINEEIETTTKHNDITFNQLKSDTLIDIAALSDAMNRATNINQMSNTIIMNLVKSGHEEQSEEELKNILNRKYHEISDHSGNLNAIRNGDVTLNKLIEEIKLFQNLSQRVLGNNEIITLNAENIETYNNPKLTNFPLGIVVHDLTLLNLRIQNMQNKLLQYYKGKVS